MAGLSNAVNNKQDDLSMSLGMIVKQIQKCVVYSTKLFVEMTVRKVQITKTLVILLNRLIRNSLAAPNEITISQRNYVDLFLHLLL